MKLKIILISIIVALLVGIGLFVGFNWDYVVSVLTNEKTYTATQVDEIKQEYEDTYVKELKEKIQEIERQKLALQNSENNNSKLRKQLETEQRKYEELLSIYNELKNNNSASAQEMLDLLLYHGDFYRLQNNTSQVFISGCSLSYKYVTYFYDFSTHESKKFENIGMVTDWYVFDNVYYGNSNSNIGNVEFIRIDGDSLEDKVLNCGFISNSEDFIYGTDLNGSECLLFSGNMVYENETKIMKIDLNSEEVSILEDDILNVDDITLDFQNALWDTTNTFISNDNEIYRFNSGKFEKCFTLKHPGNVWFCDRSYPFSQKVLFATNGIGDAQLINLSNFKTIDLTFDDSFASLPRQISENVIYIGENEGKLYKIDIATMTSEEVGTIKGRVSVHENYNQLYAETFFIQNADSSYSLKAVKYGEDELTNIHDFTSDVEFVSLRDGEFGSFRLQIREGGEEKTYEYDFETGVFGERN